MELQFDVPAELICALWDRREVTFSSKTFAYHGGVKP